MKTEVYLVLLHETILWPIEQYFLGLRDSYSTLTVGYSKIKLYDIHERRWRLEMRNYVYEKWNCHLVIGLMIGFSSDHMIIVAVRRRSWSE